MKIAILGTRGIPNNYGGFEQFAEYISTGLVEKGYDVTVYNPHFHNYKHSMYKGVHIRHIYCPEKTLGAAAHFIYDWKCMKDALAQDFDIIYEAGYHSNAPSYYLLDKSSPILITNMDGIEWKRGKWNWCTRLLIRVLEKIAIKKSDLLVSDNVGIQDYYKQTFGKESTYIAYGADLVNHFDETTLSDYSVKPYSYFLLIARLEPENNIDTILDGYLRSNSKAPFLVVGNHGRRHGIYLRKKYANTQIHFLGSIYEKSKLDDLRAYAAAYFHGHSVGGTNPSLLEAMASNSFVVAHDNCFNRSVLKDNAFYFVDAHDVSNFINSIDKHTLTREQKMRNNRDRIASRYSWSYILDRHIELFTKAQQQKLHQ